MSSTSPVLASQADIDAFIDAVWLEDGLSANTLSAYRRDLTAFAQWLEQPAANKAAELGRPRAELESGAQTLSAAQAADIELWFVAKHPDSRATTANRRLASLRRFYAWALREHYVQRDPCLAL